MSFMVEDTGFNPDDFCATSWWSAVMSKGRAPTSRMAESRGRDSIDRLPNGLDPSRADNIGSLSACEWPTSRSISWSIASLGFPVQQQGASHTRE